MSEHQITGHKNVIDYFKKMQENNRLSHAYLFIGKEGIGKRKTAWYIAAYLNCSSKTRPCFTCSECRRIAQRVHPDIIEISPKNSIGIADIKELQNRVYLKNFESTYKIIIIDEADTLTHDAANAFLKTLEEPPPNVLFFLITSKPENILSTIRSRTQNIWFSLKFSEAKTYLRDKKYADSDIDFLLKLADGRISLIEKLATDAYLSKRKKIFAGSALAFNIYETDRKSLKETMLLVLSFLRDCLVIKLGRDTSIMNRDLMKKLTDYSNRFSARELSQKIQQLFALNETLDNININLANNITRDILQTKDDITNYVTTNEVYVWK